jgi:hypothetical protein
MPEMLPYLGRRFTVEARMERACDTITPGGTRRMPDTVLLDDLRCDGSAHAGCQAGCRLYWKEAWLRRVSRRAPKAKGVSDGAYAELERLARQHTTRPAEKTAPRVVFRCQATEFVRATELVPWNDIWSLFRQFTCGNVKPVRLIRVGLRAFVTELKRKFKRLSDSPFEHRGGAKAVPERVALKPGDVVQVRSREEIAATLDETGKNRGLWFDKEMVPFCGQTHRVLARVERFIDEPTGEMVELKSDCFALEGVVCSGDLSDRRWFCPRAIYPWWRQAWLRPVDEGAAAGDEPPIIR